MIGELVANEVSEVSAGLVATAEATVLALTAILAAKFSAKFRFLHLLAIGATILIAGNVASIYASNVPILLALRAFCGIGEGLLLLVSSAAIAGFKNSESAYGQINTVSVASGFTVYAVANFVAQQVAGGVAFWIYLGFALVLLPALFFMPWGMAFCREVEVKNERTSASHDAGIGWISIAIFISCCSIAAIWAFYVVLGLRAGLSETATNDVMTIGIAMAFLGSLLASFAGDRFGRLLPLFLGLAIMAVSTSVIGLSENQWAFTIFSGLNLFGLYIYVPYFLAFSAHLDPSGRGSAIAAGVFMMASAAGPYLGGVIVGSLGVGYFALVAIVSSTIAFSVFWSLDRNLAIEQSALPIAR